MIQVVLVLCLYFQVSESSENLHLQLQVASVARRPKIYSKNSLHFLSGQLWYRKTATFYLTCYALQFPAVTHGTNVLFTWNIKDQILCLDSFSWELKLLQLLCFKPVKLCGKKNWVWDLKTMEWLIKQH